MKYWPDRMDLRYNKEIYWSEERREKLDGIPVIGARSQCRELCVIKGHQENVHRRGDSGPECWKIGLVQSLSHAQLFATPWTAACQASLSITSSWSLKDHCSSMRRSWEWEGMAGGENKRNTDPKLWAFSSSNTSPSKSSLTSPPPRNLP